VIRKAKIQDLDAIVELAIESVANDALPVKVDRDAMIDMGRQLIGNPAHFVWVAEKQGSITACVAALVQKGFWFKGLQASVILYYGKSSDAGAALLIKQFASWVKSRSAIKLAVVELEPKASQKLIRLYKKLGFTRESTNLTYVRNV
jgi:hypothetical protein